MIAMPDRAYTINDGKGGGSALSLPLDLIALIIAHVCLNLESAKY